LIYFQQNFDRILARELGKLVEEKIRQAIKDGEFDNLKSIGKPLNLDTYFAPPADLRVGYSLLKSNNFAPEEVEILKEISQLKEKINGCRDEIEKTQLTALRNQKTLALSIILERNKQKR
jgi:hypothetical protein